jgi:hypothetical protein
LQTIGLIKWLSFPTLRLFPIWFWFGASMFCKNSFRNCRLSAVNAEISLWHNRKPLSQFLHRISSVGKASATNFTDTTTKDFKKRTLSAASEF